MLSNCCHVVNNTHSVQVSGPALCELHTSSQSVDVVWMLLPQLPTPGVVCSLAASMLLLISALRRRSLARSTPRASSAAIMLILSSRLQLDVYNMMESLLQK